MRAIASSSPPAQNYFEGVERSDELWRLFFTLLGRHAFDRWYVDGGDPTKAEADDIFAGRSYLWAEAGELCQSPIERRLFAHLLFIADGYSYLSSADYPFGDDDIVTTIEPQGAVGRYRADFLITVRLKRLVTLLAVECDGHEFHERTKEQAARDRARDRCMTSAGVRVLRFTGSEIFRDAQKCADEVEELVQRERLNLERQLPGWAS